ncbi:MAG: polysaccharide deacetylase family protein [Bacteroidota bacterium]|nr:polysaccharide deacetylase family protein [Bacteroidota bacterium]
MKRVIFFILSFAFVKQTWGYSLSNDTLKYDIATWLDYKDAAISFTYDDNSITQFSIGIPLLDKYNLPGTFFVITKQIDDGFCGLTWKYLKSLTDNGHEIASHTVNHLQLNKLSSKDCERELKESQHRIEEMIPGYKCETIAYPGSSTNDTAIALAQKYYIAARSGGGKSELKNPPNFWNLNSFILDSNSSTELMNHYIDYSLSFKGWCIEMIHGIDSLGHDPINSHKWEEHLKYVKKNETKIWAGTMKDVVKYIKERQSAKVHFSSITDSMIRFTVNSDLDKNIYGEPLTLSVNLPAGFDSVAIYKNDVRVSYSMRKDFKGKAVVFNTVPDGGEIIFQKIFTTKQENNGNGDLNGYQLFQNYPNPFNPVTNIVFRIPQRSNVKIKVYDMLGRLVADLLDEDMNAGIGEVKFNGSKLRSGIYTYEILAQNFHKKLKMNLIK